MAPVGCSARTRALLIMDILTDTLMGDGSALVPFCPFPGSGGLIPVPLASQSSFAIRSPSEAPYARVPSLGCPTTPVPLRSDWNHGVQHLSCCCYGRHSSFWSQRRSRRGRGHPADGPGGLASGAHSCALPDSDASCCIIFKPT